LKADIEDNPENFTRFFLVRRAAESAADPESNKISLAFSVENRPGSLVAVLNELAALGTNLTKIESRPVHGKPWSTSSMWIARFSLPKRARGRWKRWQALRHGEGAGRYKRLRFRAILPMVYPSTS